MYTEAKKCYERLSQDFHQVKKVIETGDLENASDMWRFALLYSHYFVFQPYISEVVFLGPSFNAYCDIFQEKLEKRDKHGINFCVEGLQAIVAQEKLRREALKKHPELKSS